MRYLTYYKLVLKRKSSDTQLLSILLMFLSCLALLFSFLSSIVDSKVSYLIHLLVIYLIISYNSPLLNQEFNKTRFSTFRLTNSTARELLIYQLFENNLVFPIILVYCLGAIVFNLFDVYKIFYLIYSLVLIVNLFLLKMISRTVIKALFKIISLYSFVLSLIDIKWLPVLIVLGLLIFIYLLDLVRLINDDITNFNTDSYFRKKAFKTSLIWKYMIYRSSKIIIYLLLSGTIGFVFYQLDLKELVWSFLFIALLELELSYSEKYKYRYKFVNRYYFLKKSPLTFWGRFRLSNTYFKVIELSLIIIVFGISNKASIINIILSLFFLLILGFVYYYLEEKMFSINKKITTLPIQYLTFIIFIGLNYMLR